MSAESRPLLNNDRSTPSDEESQLKQEITSSTRVIPDAIIGLSDGLTVPFALTAGLSGLGDAKVVISGGLAELVSGCISMGLGGFLAAQSEKEHYDAVYSRAMSDFRDDPEIVTAAVQKALGEFDLSKEAIDLVVRDLKKNEENASRFTVKMVHDLEKPDPHRELMSAATIGGSYFVGGFIPLLPYFFADTVKQGFQISCIIMLITLFSFGYTKAVASIGRDSTQKVRISDGVQQVFVGGLAAVAAWALVKFVEN